jgi:hypothetical protein
MDTHQPEIKRQAARGMPGHAVTADRLGLEEIVHLTNKIGMEFVDAKKDAELLELLKPTVRARIMLRYDDGSMSEVKLKRITETDEEYIECLTKLAEAKAKSEKLKIRYESYKNLFEAKRSLLSYQKAEMKLI